MSEVLTCPRLPFTEAACTVSVVSPSICEGSARARSSICSWELRWWTDEWDRGEDRSGLCDRCFEFGGLCKGSGLSKRSDRNTGRANGVKGEGIGLAGELRLVGVRFPKMLSFAPRPASEEPETLEELPGTFGLSVTSSGNLSWPCPSPRTRFTRPCERACCSVC